MSIVTAHQSTRKGAESGTVRSIHASEDWSTVHTADTVMTFSATEAEKSMGLGRLYVEHNRNQRDHFGVVLSQALPIGQFARQSVPLSKDYWDLMPKDGDEEGED